MQVAAVPSSSRQEGQEGSLPPGGTGELGRNTEFHDSQQMCGKGIQITYLKRLTFCRQKQCDLKQQDGAGYFKLHLSTGHCRIFYTHFKRCMFFNRSVHCLDITET